MPASHNKMQECITSCWTCRHECQETLFNHCLEKGGEHVAPDHVKIMADCIQICQTAADFMTRGSHIYEAICAACADVCDACADSCEELGSKKLEECADSCRKCADLCREMGGSGMTGTRREETGQSPASMM